jgi:dolichol kinase
MSLLASLLQAAVLKDPDDIEVQSLIKSTPSEVLFGPLQMTAIMIWIGLTRFGMAEAALLAAAVGVGDGLAPLTGNTLGRHVYSLPWANRKTIEGSLVGVFLGTIGACYLYMYCLGIPWLSLHTMLAYGGIAAVVEGTAPSNMDNLMVGLALHFSMERVLELLPQ